MIRLAGWLATRQPAGIKAMTLAILNWDTEVARARALFTSDDEAALTRLKERAAQRWRITPHALSLAEALRIETDQAIHNVALGNERAGATLSGRNVETTSAG